MRINFFNGKESKTASLIDYEMLKRREPILFQEMVYLYEDELNDFGQSFMIVRIVILRSSINSY